MAKPDLHSRRITLAAVARTDRGKARSRETPQEPVRATQAGGSLDWEVAKNGCILEHILKTEPTGFAYSVDVV